MRLVSEITKVNSMSLQSAAMWYAEQGWLVFPVAKGEKTPVPFFPWKEGASSDPEVVKVFWDTWPGSNIGLKMGEDSGVIAVDVDIKKAQDGWASLADLAPVVAETLTQITPSGGAHLIYSYSPEHAKLINFTHRGKHQGIDLRVDGGYILVSPSIIGDKRYTWSTDLDSIPYMPSSLYDPFLVWSGEGANRTLASDTPEHLEEEALPEVSKIGLAPRYLSYLDEGNTDPWEEDESKAIFSVAGALMRSLKNAAQVYSIMLNNDYAYECAHRHSATGNPEKWLWKYGIGPLVTKIQKRQDYAQSFTKIKQSHEEEAENLQKTEKSPVDKSAVFRADGIVTDNPLFTSAYVGITAEDKEPNWIVEGVFERGQVGLFYGPSQSLKSFVSIDLSCRIMLGLPWAGHKTLCPGPIFYIAGEGNRNIFKRIEGWVLNMRNNHNSDVEYRDLRHLYVSSSGVDFSDISTLDPIQKLAESLNEAPSLVIVDTLNRNISADENSAEAMGGFLGQCSQLAQIWDTGILVVHHSGVSDVTRMRGSSALRSNADFVMQSARRKSREGKVTRITVTKTKDCEEPLPVEFAAVSIPLYGESGNSNYVDTLALNHLEKVAVSFDNAYGAEVLKDPLTSTLFDGFLALYGNLPDADTKAAGIPREDLFDKVREMWKEVDGGDTVVPDHILTRELSNLIASTLIEEISLGFLVPGKSLKGGTRS